MKIRVGVFFGGQSVEHEVSIISALQAIENMDKEKYDVVPVYITKDNRMYTGDALLDVKAFKNVKEVLSKSKRVLLVNNGKCVDLIHYPAKIFGNNVAASIDVAFPIVHGTNVEDGTLQGYLKMLNIPYVGCDVTSSVLGMDKYAMKTVLKDNDIPVLDGYCFNSKEYMQNSEKVIAGIEEKMDYPVIVKPVNLGSSVGIKIAKDRDGLKEALENAFMFAITVIVEKAITNLKEINCAVLGDYEKARASECEEPVKKDEILSFGDKYLSQGGSKGAKSAGGEASGMASLSRKLPAEISDEVRSEIRDMAVKTFKVLGCSGVSRIDFMMDMDTNKVYVNEINTIPGSLSFYLWTPLGVEYKQLLSEMIELAFKREREQAEVSYTFDTNILDAVSLGGSKGSKGAKC